MQGYNGSQLWDTTFAVQAICATGLAAEFTDCLRKAQHYVDITQVRTLESHHRVQEHVVDLCHPSHPYSMHCSVRATEDLACGKAGQL